MDVVNVNVCTVHMYVRLYRCTYMTYVVLACQTCVHTNVCKSMSVYMQLFLSTYSCMYISLQLLFKYMWSTCSYLMCKALLVVWSL